MNKLQTFCGGCVFAQYSNDIQNGCTLNRPQKLGVDKTVKKEEGKTSYLLERVCNVHRPKEWLDFLDFDQTINPEKEVLQEVFPRIGYFVRLDTSNEHAIQELEATLTSITKHKVSPGYVVVISDSVEFNEEVWTLFIKFFGDQQTEDVKTPYHIVQMTENPEKVESIMDAAFQHAQNGWIMTLTSGDVIDKDISSILHKMINIDMKQIVLVEPIDGYNRMIFPAYLFKFLNGNKVKVFQDEIVDGSKFLDKIKNAAKRTQSDTLITWEEFYAS